MQEAEAPFQAKTHDPSEPAAESATEVPGLGEQPPTPVGEEESDERRVRRRRRGRRGGRRGRERDGAAAHDAEPGALEAGGDHDAGPDTAGTEGQAAAEDEAYAEEARAEPAADPRSESEPERSLEILHGASDTEAQVEVRWPADEPGIPAEPEPEHAEPPAAVETPPSEPNQGKAAPAEPEPSDPLKPTRKGWWQRRLTVD
jgi:ribonuclease E